MCLGWKMERGSSCLHCTILPSHTLDVVNQFILDLTDSVNTVKVYYIVMYYGMYNK